MLSRNLERSLHQALAFARERRHEYATLEHLLLALTDDQDSVAVLRACGVEVEKIQQDLNDYLDNELDNLVVNRDEDPKPTASFQRVVQRAAIHVQTSGRQEVTGANVLVAMFSERESHAVYYLQEQEMTRFDAVNYISHGIAKVPGRSESRPVDGTDEEAAEEKNVKQGREALTAYCVNLNEKAAEGKIDPLIGRAAEIERTIQVLCRRTKNNPCCMMRPSLPSIWGRCWPGHGTGAISRNA
jgi:ATP-dependent Clp protease ATP-binding subunit ClpA